MPAKLPRFVLLGAAIYGLSLPYDIIKLDWGFSPSLPAGLFFLCVLAFYYLQPGVSFGERNGSGRGALFLLAAWTLTTCLWAINMDTALLATFGMALNLLISACALPLILQLWRTMASCFALAASFIAIQLIGGEGQESWKRAQFMGADENITAFVLVVAASSAMALSLRHGAKGRVFWYAAALLFGAGVLYTGSRTGLISFAAVAVATSAVVWRSSNRRGWVKVLPLALVGIGWYAFTRLQESGVISERLLDFSGASLSGDSSRAGIADQFLVYVDSWALTGVGYGVDADFLAAKSGVYLNAHGFFWKTWVELGMVGLVIYLFLFSQMLANAAREGEWQPVRILYLAALLPFLISLGTQWTAVFWFVATLLMAPDEHQKEWRHEIRRIR